MISVIDRTIIYSGDFDEELAHNFFKEFITLDKVKAPIEIICTGSDGGAYDTAAASMIDLVLNSENIITSNIYGCVSSSAALLFMAGDYRIMNQRSILMFHKGSIGIESDLGELKKLTEVTERQALQDLELLTTEIRGPIYWQTRLDEGDVYVFPQEALESGLAHEVYI